jgi:hypothetical protein
MANPHHPRSISVSAGSQLGSMEYPSRLGHADGPRISITGAGKDESLGGQSRSEDGQLDEFIARPPNMSSIRGKGTRTLRP